MSFDFRSAEERLWLDGRDAYVDLMHPDAVMIFPFDPPILQGKEILDRLSSSPRWIDVTFRSVHEVEVGVTHAFAYHAEAIRDGSAQPYRAGCLSVWAEGEDGWRLISHQQTPLE